MKRVISGILITCIILMMIPIVPKVHATVVVPEDDSTHYYFLNHFETEEYSSSDFLTLENYNEYYDKLTGSNKTDVNMKFPSYDNYNMVKAIVNDMMNPNYNTTGDITSTYFTPVIYNGETIPFEDCKCLIALIGTGSNDYWSYFLFYSPTGADIVFSGTSAISSDPFVFTNQNFGVSFITVDDTLHGVYTSGQTERLDSYIDSSTQNSIFTFNPSANQGSVFTDMVYLFTSDSLTGINTDVSAYTAYVNNTYPYAIDRRPQRFIDKVDPSETPTDQIISDGFDPLLFNGSLGFNWFNSSGSTNYISSLDTFKPFIQLKYKINNYTDIHKDDVSLVWDAELYMKLKYDSEISGGDFITSCRYNASGTWDLVGHEDQFTLLASQESNLFTLTNVRNTSGSNSMGNEFRDTNTINQNISIGISAYKHDPDVEVMSESQLKEYINDLFHGNKGNSTDGSYGYIHFNVYLKNDITGERSVVYSSVFDLFNNKFSDNKSQLVNNDDTAYSDFVDSFNYLDQNGDLSLVEYAQPFDVDASGGVGYGGNASIGNISIGAGEIIVDMPADEWLQHSPNFNNLLSTVKSGLTDVADGSNSVMTLMRNTYTVFPVDVWGYLTLAIAIISGLAVVRYIRRG